MRTVCVVVNWNGGDENLECVQSLLDQGSSPTDIVFVDNGSSDGSLESVRQRFPELTYLCNEENLGFGDGSNQGARLALERGADAVFFVNNDVALPKGVLARLESELESNPSCGIVGPRVLFKHDERRIWAAGGTLTWRQNVTTLRGNGQLDGEAWRSVQDVDYVPGCALLARRDVFERVGFFDGDYFAYMEDVDLCLMARKEGFGVRLCGDVHVLHAASSATGGGYSARRKYMNGVNSVWFLRKHAGFAQWASFLLFDVLSLPFVWLVALPRGRSKAVLAKALGILHGILGRRVSGDVVQPGASRFW